MNEKKLFLVGDLHGRFDQLNYVIEQYKPDMVWSLGDFGYWPRFPRFSLNKINNSIPIYFLHGNHEDLDSLWELDHSKIQEVHHNIFYVPSGHVIEHNGLNYLFIGGADSIDKQYRKEGFDWFRQETINQKQFNDIMDRIGTQKIDVVLSHTCPETIFPCLNLPKITNESDPTRVALDVILNFVKPAKWYFSHFHMYKKGCIKDCAWICINNVESNKIWWEEI